VRFELPDEIRGLMEARNRLRDYYGHPDLRFTPDGNLLGDLGEALAVELFGLELGRRCGPGVDGTAPDGRTVQVKVSASKLGPAFRRVETKAEHLLFFSLDFDACCGVVDFNGPEVIATNLLTPGWSGQRSLSLNQIRRADTLVPEEARLPTRSPAGRDRPNGP